MKENEAPEKLYYAPYGDIREDHPITDNDIEYIRTDAFIEKACDYLQKNIWRIIYEEAEFRQRFVTDFENYMKGE